MEFRPFVHWQLHSFAMQTFIKPKQNAMEEHITPQEEPNDHGQHIPKPKWAWKAIYLFLIILGLSSGIIGLVYRQLPKKSEVLAKRKIPKIRSVYALILSPIPMAKADSLSRAIKSDIGKDSIVVKMVVGGTAVYKHCTSSDEFRRLIDTASVRARKADIEIQNLLHTKMVDIITSDTLPARLYVIGSAPEMPAQELRMRMQSIIEYLDIRNREMGRLTIVNALEPKNSTQNRVYLDFYKKVGIEVEE
ncbi:MAG: hypothetical protein ACKOFB_07560 [bacterium]